MCPAEFVATVKSRLCVDFLSEDQWCPLCDSVLDTKGFHARCCVAGGDRVACHNGVRNCVFRVARAATLRPELERSGLLLPSRPDDTEASRRRPAGRCAV